MNGGPKPGRWRVHWQCGQCKLHGCAEAMLCMDRLCPLCGSDDLGAMSARPMRYRWLHRLALFLAGYPQPRNYWETGPL